MKKSKPYDFEAGAQRAMTAFQELGNITNGFFSFLRTEKVEAARAEATRALAVIDDDLTKLLPSRTSSMSGSEVDVFYKAITITSILGCAYTFAAAEKIEFALEKFRAHPEILE